MARGQRRLGALPGPLLGHAAAHLALRRLRHDTCIGSVAELGRAIGARPGRPRPPPPVRRRGHVPLRPRGLRRGRPSRGARCSTRGSTRARCRRPSTTTPSPGRERVRPRRSRPTSSARPSTRRGAGSTRCSPSTPSSSTRRPTATSCASASSSTRTGRRCRSRAGNVIDPWEIFATPRRRRAALVLLLGRLAVDHPPGLRRGHPRRRPGPDAAHALERALLLRRPTPTSTAGRRPRTTPRTDRGRADPRARPVDPLRARRHRRRRHRRPGGLRRPHRGQPPRPLRRRPLELVRAPVPAAVLEGLERRRRPRHPPPRASSGRPAARPVLPLPGRRGAPHPARRAARSTWPTGPGRRAGTTPRWPSAWPPPAGWSPSAARPAPTPRSRSASRCARALLLHPGGLLDDDVRSRDRRRSST